MTRLHRTARWYAMHDLAVFPCAPRNKAPLISKEDGGNGYLDATCDLEKIDGWWSDCPTANIGLALAVSDLVVVDVDERHGGRAQLEALLRIHGPLPPTRHEVTGANLEGDHYVYRRPAGVPTTKAKLAAGIELMGIGYIITSPSVHPDGGTYRWVSGGAPWERPIIEAPEWVVAPLRAAPQPREVAPATGPVAESLLGRAFKAANWWIRSRGDEKALVRCPWEDKHNTGRRGDSSTVLFAPTTADKIGAFCCKHANCADLRLRDVLQKLPSWALEQAEREMGRAKPASSRDRSIERSSEAKLRVTTKAQPIGTIAASEVPSW